MRVGLLTDGLAHRSLADTIDWVASELPAVRDLELGTGGYSPAPHCDRRALLDGAAARRGLLGSLEARGLRLAALNVSGNPLHPDARSARRDDAALRETIELAALLGVDRVVAMAGCPGAGASDRSAPHFVAGGWLPDLEGIVDWQWRERLLPYWRELAGFAQRTHPELLVCFELHPGSCVYNSITFEWIAEAGQNLAVNLDPSHLLWQGMDPLAVVRHLGGRVSFAHGKDTLEAPDQMALNGVLDCRWPESPAELPWNFTTVGRGRDGAWWASFVRELSEAGYDGVISIEYEDPFTDAETSIAEAAHALEAAIALADGSPEVRA